MGKKSQLPKMYIIRKHTQEKKKIHENGKKKQKTEHKNPTSIHSDLKKKKKQKELKRKRE